MLAGADVVQLLAEIGSFGTASGEILAGGLEIFLCLLCLRGGGFGFLAAGCVLAPKRRQLCVERGSHEHGDDH